MLSKQQIAHTSEALVDTDYTNVTLHSQGVRAIRFRPAVIFSVYICLLAPSWLPPGSLLANTAQTQAQAPDCEAQTQAQRPHCEA